jgi:hypothetical protein
MDHPPEDAPEGSDPENERPSVLDSLRQSSTTLFEVGRVAGRLSMVPGGRTHQRHLVRQLVGSGIAGLCLTLMAAIVFAGGTVQLVLGILAGATATALGVFGALRGVSKLASRFGARTLPGSPWLWVGGVALIAGAGTTVAGFSVWEVVQVASLRVQKKGLPEPKAATTASASGKRSDARVRRDVHIGLEQGVLYAPPKFRSPDGQFDLVVHFHGNSRLVEQSVAATDLNALVAIINVGDGSGPYSKAMQNPYAFDRMLTTIERRAQKQLRLENALIRRIALSAWSAGFASVGQILSSRSRLDRIDAVLLMDAPHAKYAPGPEKAVYIPSIDHYVAFAERAVAGQKLMVITHSAIPTEGYPSTTFTTDALLGELDLRRETVTSDTASPPPVELSVAKRAFPDKERNWLQVVSRAERRHFHLYGCTGTQKGDHIAHLAQMSVTMLPPLIERWR